MSVTIGITGHQRRDGIEWTWVESAISFELARMRPVQRCLTSLARGSDQVFASAALALGISVRAVIPMPGYEDFFEDGALQDYRRLLRQCDVIRLKWQGSDDQCFLEAGRYIAKESDCLIAVWDGQPARGKGGTADVVTFARSLSRSITHINPITREVLHT